jgi:leucyl aminopeptidase (aminopeptidase T)
MSELEKAALVAVRDCLGIRSDESLLVVTDPPLAHLARALAEAARPLAREVLVLEYGVRELNGQEPPAPVPEAMKGVDAVLAVTTRSITHTSARRAAVAAGARVATMPGITEGCLVRTMSADYEAIARRTHRVTELLTAAKVARVTTALGTDITMPIEGIAAIASTGLIRARGQWGNLPSGEAYMRPDEGRSEGVIVVDASLAGIGKLSSPVTITVERGMAVAVSGGDEAKRFQAQLDKAGPAARAVAELGVGTNDRAIVTGAILEDEKILGTVHIAFGNNVSMGGTVDVAFHVDGILLRPTLYLDGKPILVDGKPLFD